MVVFLVTSFLAFLIVSLVFLSQPPEKGSTRTSIPGIGELELKAGIKGRLRRALFAGILLLCFAAAWLLFTQAASFRSPYLPNLLFGLLFGPVFAIWLVGIFQTSGRLSLPQSMQGIVLVVLFIVGLLGAETARIADHYSRRISKIGLGGTEIAFADLPRLARSTGEAGTPTPPPGQKEGADSPNGSRGLYYLSILDDLIERDCGFLSVTDRHSGECESENVGPLSSWDLRKATSFTTVTISAYARCLVGAFDITLDAGFVSEHLRPFASLFMELTAPSAGGKHFVERALATHETQTTRLLRRLQPAFLAEPHSTTDGLTAEEYANHMRSARPVRIACAALLRAVCGDPFVDGGNAHDFLDQRNWRRREKEDRKAWRKRTMEDWSVDKFHRGSIESCLERFSPQQTGVQDISTLKEITSFSEARRTQLMAEFKNFYAPNNFAAGFRLRPYVAIAHASLMVQLGEYEAGLSKLYEWVEEFEKSQSGDPNLLWYSIRARSLLVIYADEWLTKLGPSAPEIVRAEHLANLRKFLELMPRVPLAASVLNDTDFKRFDIEKTGYSRVVREIPACKYQSDREASIILSYLGNGNLFAYHALRHRSYERHESYVRAIVDDAINADLSCIAKAYSPNDAAIVRADALDLKANIFVRDAAKLKAANDAVSAEKTLRQALAAVDLAISTIADAASDDNDKKKYSRRFVEKLSQTKALASQNTATQTRDLIRRRLEDLN